MPGIGSDTDGGENAGGTGIWILPCAATMSTIIEGESGQRASKQLAAVDAGLVLKMPVELDATVAMLVSEVSGEIVALDVVGSSVHVPQEALDVLSGTDTTAKVVITDTHQVGYVIELQAKRTEGSEFTKVDLKVY